MLERRFATLRTEGNQNNEVGLPLTVLAARARARRRGPRDGDVRRRRDPRAGGDRAAVDRDRDRGPAGPPVADRLARGDRGRQGRAGRGAARGRRRRGRDPQRRRRAGRAGWPRARAPASTTYGFADDADVRADEVESRGLDGHGVPAPSRRPATADRRDRRRLGRLAVHNALAGDRRRARRGPRARRDRARARRAVAGRAPLDGDPRGRRRRSSTTRTTPRPGRCGAALELLAGLPGRAPDRDPGRDARARRRARRGPPRGRRGGRRGPRRCWSSSTARRVAPPRGSSTARSRAGLAPSGSITAVAAAGGRARRGAMRPARRRRCWSRRRGASSSSGSSTRLVAALGGPERRPA